MEDLESDSGCLGLAGVREAASQKSEMYGGTWGGVSVEHLCLVLWYYSSVTWGLFSAMATLL